MAEIKQKSLRIREIRRAAGKNGLPGNLRINDMWFSGREWRNNLLGAELPIEIALPTFLNCTLGYKELTITQEDLDQGGGQYKHIVNGREVTYKKPGTVNIELIIDFTTLNVTESLLNTNRLKHLFGTGRPVPRPTQGVEAPASQPEVIEEPVTTNTTAQPTTPQAEVIEEEKLTEPEVEPA